MRNSVFVNFFSVCTFLHIISLTCFEWLSILQVGHISLVRLDGRYPVSFFLSGCLEPLFRCWVPFPCICMLPLSVSFILMHIPWRHNHWYIVSHDVLRLCIISAFCMSYLVCDAFQDVWCVLSYFNNFHCVEASHPETIEVTLSHFFLMHRFYSISLWWLFLSPGTRLIDAVPDYSACIFFYVMRFGTFTSIRSVSLNALVLFCLSKYLA